MRYADVIGGFVFAVFGAIIILGTLSFPAVPNVNIGPAFFPRAVGGLLIVLGLVLSVVSIWKRQDTEKRFFEGTAGTVLGTIVIFALYLVCLKFFGFLIATFLFMTVLTRFLKEKRWLVIFGVSIFFTGFLYYVFEITLNIPLPGGVFFS